MGKARMRGRCSLSRAGVLGAPGLFFAAVKGSGGTRLLSCAEQASPQPPGAHGLPKAGALPDAPGSLPPPAPPLRVTLRSCCSYRSMATHGSVGQAVAARPKKKRQGPDSGKPSDKPALGKPTPGQATAPESGFPGLQCLRHAERVSPPPQKPAAPSGRQLTQTWSSGGCCFAAGRRSGAAAAHVLPHQHRQH